jgi:hypothetical protein
MRSTSGRGTRSTHSWPSRTNPSASPGQAHVLLEPHPGELVVGVGVAEDELDALDGGRHGPGG